MDKQQEEIAKIKEILKDKPRGATVSDIARKIKLNRNSASKYLEMLVVSGQVEMKRQGPAKVFFLSRRVPISAMLSFSTDMIAVLDSELKIVYVNDRFAEIMGASRDDLIGRQIREQGNELFNLVSIVPHMKEALGGNDSSLEFTLGADGAARYIRGRFISTVFDEGQIGVTTIYEDITDRKRSEDALRESEERYRDLYENAPNAYFSVGADGLIRICNQRACTMLGYSKDELIGRPVLSLYADTPDGIENARQVFQKFLAKEQIADEKMQMLRADGSVIWINLSISAIFDDQGNILESRSIAVDITERMQAEEALRKSEASMARAQQMSRLGSWELDVTSNMVTGSDEQYAIWDLRPGPQTLDDLLRKIHPEDREYIADGINAATNDGSPFEVEFRISLPGGERIIRSSAELRRDASGRPLTLQGVSQDITQRKLMEVALQTSQTKYRTLVENAQEGIWSIDTEARITFANPRIAEMLGGTVEEMIGMRAHDFSEKRHWPVIDVALDRRMNGLREQQDAELKTKDGRTIIASMTSSPIFDERGDYAGSISLISDVTDKRRMEEELKIAHVKLKARISDRTIELGEAMRELRQEIEERKLIEEALRLDEKKLEALVAMNGMIDQPIQKMADYAVEKAVEITGSKYGIITVVKEDMNLGYMFSYSRDVCRVCQMEEHSGVFHLDSGGLWTQPVAQRRPIIINDYGAYASKIRLPDKHMLIKRLMGVPIFYGDEIVALTIVANKESDYTAADTRQLTQLAQGFWQLIEQKLATEALGQSEADFRALINAIQESSMLIEPDGTIIAINETMARRFMMTAETMIGANAFSILPSDVAAQRKAHIDEVLQSRNLAQWEDEHNGRTMAITAYPVLSPDSRAVRVAIFSQDITERKQAEMEQATLVEFLHLVNQSSGTKDLVCKAVKFFQQKSGCEAVGVRLREGDDYPYYEFIGFRQEFIRRENNLCTLDKNGQVIRDSEGFPALDCMCGIVITGRFDPAQPFFTAKGSFWTNSTTELLATTTEKERLAKTRNVCNTEGYESFTLIALRVGDERLGVLQISDGRKGRFSPDVIARWERLADYMAVALAKFKAEEALRESEERFRRTFNQSPIGTAIVSLDYRFMRVNDELCRITGYTEEELLARGLQDITHPNDLDADIEYARKLMAGKIDHYQIDKRYIHKDGNAVWVRLWV
jgi:PAS domain S-box-containing protein